MRILLTATASYAPPRGGATRSNLIWINQLAAGGHSCRIVCGASGDGAPLPTHPSVVMQAVADPARRVQTLRHEIASFDPDWVLVSSEDVGHALLREAQNAAPGRVVFLAHTPQFFPFGPESWNPCPQGEDLVSRCAGIVAIGNHMRGYIERALKRPAAVIHPPIYGDGPFPNLACAESGMVAMINPCAVKGISIFAEVAGSLPEVEFGAVPGWGTTADDLRALDRFPNVRKLPNAVSIDELLRGVRVLLMPSLWYEGFGLIVMEAMLRGIPVVSSDSGGLLEAKSGTGFVIPVAGIERYMPAYDEHGLPKPVVRGNNVAPWVAAVRELISDRDAYRRESEASRGAAECFVRGLDPRGLERYLLSLGGPREAAPALRSSSPSMESLTPAQRELLLRRLKDRGAAR
jgi:glycosyltransferase involved in cell wall biosynthesis